MDARAIEVHRRAIEDSFETTKNELSIREWANDVVLPRRIRSRTRRRVGDGHGRRLRCACDAGTLRQFLIAAGQSRGRRVAFDSHGTSFVLAVTVMRTR
jgi:hypothetical protein